MRRDSNVPRGKKKETERGESEARQRNGKEKGVGVLRSEWLGCVGVGLGLGLGGRRWMGSGGTLERL